MTRPRILVTGAVGRTGAVVVQELMQDIASTLSKVLGRRVKYRDVSIGMFAKAATALGVGTFEVDQIRHYAAELRAGAFAVGAPTDHVERVTGRRPGIAAACA